MIYQGGWPYYFEKTELNGGVTFEVGKRFANLELTDQFGEVVSLWDFYNDDRYVIVDICVEWLGQVCINLSRWVAGERGAIFGAWSSVADAVDAGEMYWITVLVEDEDFEPANASDVAQWAAEYPHTLVPVLADPLAESFLFTDLTALPFLVLLEPDLQVLTSSAYYPAVLDAAVEVLSQP